MWFITSALFAVILTLWLTYRKSKLNYFKKLNIPGPAPSVLFGNNWELFYEGQHNCINRWIKEYGRVFGYYFGLQPVLVVADLEILRRIQLKDFQKFVNRPPLFSVGRSTTKFNRHSLTVVGGKRWKELRSIITPTFTASKLKKMSPIINQTIDELLEAVDKKYATGKSFDIYHLYQNLTMDVIARTSLGIHTNSQTDKNEPFVKLARLIFSFKMDLMSMLVFSITEFSSIFALINRLRLSSENEGKFPREELQERTAAAITARRNNPEYRRTDVLQLMIDAKRTEESVNEKNLAAGENEEVSAQNGNTKQVTEKTGRGMTDEEIVQNCALFLLAGFETTSTALAFLTHCLVYNQDIQDRVREEINENITEEELSYEAVHKLQYLDCVLNECLRLYPPITYFINRQAMEDVTIDDLRIPKNLAIQVPVYYLHHDPTIWEEPEKFNPDRFLPEEKSKRHPMAFQAFGAGPRNCIGMRFAQMEAKMAITKILRKYRLLPENGKSKEDFKVMNTILTMRPQEGVVLEVERV